MSRLLATVLTVVIAGTLSAQDVPPERLAAREWFRDAKFGMFVHWGVYSQLGQGEWVMQNRSLPVDTVRVAGVGLQSGQVRRARVGGAREGGRRPVHHDHGAPSRRLLDVRDEGHALQHRRLDAVQARPVEGARRRMPAPGHQALLLLLAARLASSRTSGRAATPARTPDGRRAASGTRYLDFMDAQLTELLTNYGPIGGIWFDGMWDQAGRRLAARSDVRADPSPAAGGAHRARTITRRRCRARTCRRSSRICRARTPPDSTRRRSARCRSRRRSR